MEMKTKIDCVCEIFDTMISCFKSEISNGLMNVDAKEAGEVADIIKDMSETEKNLREAHYYELVSEAMEQKENRRMGYNMSEKPYIDAYLYDPDFEDNMRYGYRASVNIPNRRMGYVNWDGSENEYSESYDKYMDSKRHYTETKNSANREKLMASTLETVKEMWADADAAQRSRMKADLSALVNSLNA